MCLKKLVTGVCFVQVLCSTFLIFCLLEPTYATGASVTNESTESEGTGSTGPLTLKRALSLAVMHNPELKAFSAEVQALEADTIQAGLFPNPDLEVEAENFGGSGDFGDTNVMETTIQLSQLIELGGKRPRRKKVASAELDLGRWDYEIELSDLLTEVAKSFAEVLGAQERQILREELVKLAVQVLNTVEERVRAGKVSPLEQTKARIALSTAKIDLDSAKRDLNVSRRQLAATWGSKAPLFQYVEGELFRAVPIPPPEQLESQVSHNPNVSRWSSESAHRRAVAELASANGIPDVTFSFGAKRHNEDDDTAFVAGFSLPIPIFDRNQGEVLSAQHRLVKVKEEEKAARLSALSALGERYESLSGAYAESMALKEDVLVAAQETFEAVTEGYEAGKFGVLDVLDAQRTLFEVKERYIDALVTYHIALADVERLTGAHLKKYQFSKLHAVGNKRPQLVGKGL